MIIVVKKTNAHADYVQVTKSENLIASANQSCNQRQLPCGQNTR